MWVNGKWKTAYLNFLFNLLIVHTASQFISQWSAKQRISKRRHLPCTLKKTKNLSQVNDLNNKDLGKLLETNQKILVLVLPCFYKCRVGQVSKRRDFQIIWTSQALILILVAMWIKPIHSEDSVFKAAVLVAKTQVDYIQRN